MACSVEPELSVAVEEGLCIDIPTKVKNLIEDIIKQNIEITCSHVLDEITTNFDRIDDDTMLGILRILTVVYKKGEKLNKVKKLIALNEASVGKESAIKEKLTIEERRELGDEIANQYATTLFLLYEYLDIYIKIMYIIQAKAMIENDMTDYQNQQKHMDWHNSTQSTLEKRQEEIAEELKPLKVVIQTKN